jgi:hypothetical protein
MADFSLPDWLSLEVRDLISSMLKKNPLERIKLRNSHCYVLIIVILQHCISVSDPDPHGTALILLSWVRIRIGNADPDKGTRKSIKINK